MELRGGRRTRLSSKPAEGPPGLTRHHPRGTRDCSKLLGWAGSFPLRLPIVATGFEAIPLPDCPEEGLWGAGPSRKRKKQDVLVSFKVRVVF